jgi:1-phosphofructokinase
MNQAARVVTVTINPTIDQTIAIPNFTAGAVNRVQSSQVDPGGKGINVASYLTDYGQPATVTGFLGADNDEIFRRFFARKGIDDRCVRVAGQTRICIKVVDEAQQRTTDINFPGQAPDPADVERLFGILGELAAAHEWFVLSGSIPGGMSPGVYRRMVAALAGKKVVLDTSGEGFRQAVTAGPWLVKPNLDELREFAGERLDTPAAIVRVARALAREYVIASVVVSMGKEGAIFVEEAETLWAVPPTVAVVSTVGAGDALAAGIVAGKLRGLALAECARLATAFATVAVTRIGSGLPSLEAVQAALGQVTIRDMGQGQTSQGFAENL